MTRGSDAGATRLTEADLARHWQLEVLRHEQRRERLVFLSRLACRPGDGRVRLARVVAASGSSFLVDNAFIE